MSKWFARCLGALLCANAVGAQAQGMPVIDVSNIAQAVKQVTAWKQQYQQMTQQIAAMTGTRGMATLLPKAAPAMPGDWHEAMASLSPLAQELRKAQSVLTPAQLASLPPDLRTLVSQTADLSAANQAMAQVAYNDAAARQARLATMSTALGAANDPKAAYDLSNAIAIEQAGLLQDHNQLLAAANGAAAQLQAQQRIINDLRSASVGTGAFPKLNLDLN
jgi:type IV secretion system protein VirB5